MKYEYLAGNPAMFIGMPSSVVVLVNAPHSVEGLTSFGDVVKTGMPVIAMRRIKEVPYEMDLTGNIDELITPEFSDWWEKHGQLVGSGGGDRERTFAFAAFRYLMPKILGQKQPEPNRWTVADQKAGRLPDVGSLIMEVESQYGFEFVGVCAGSKRFAVKDVLDGLIYFYSKEMIVPIETPEEKAQRLRSEWCSECTSKYYPRGHKGFPEMIYDALLSGALSVPTKGGE